jgi:hypothetical protein
MPVKQQFLRTSGLTRIELRAKLGLLPDVFTVLTVGGSLGLARYREVAWRFRRSSSPAGTAPAGPNWTIWPGACRFHAQ